MPDPLSLAKTRIQECKKTKSLVLDLGGCGIADLNDLPELFECDHLETLNLFGEFTELGNGDWQIAHREDKKNSFRKIPAKIGRLKNLKRLFLAGLGNYRLKSIDIASISKLTNLEELFASQHQITNTDFLEKLTNLKFVTFRDCRIRNIGFVEKLYKLKNLNLEQNQISEIGFLVHLEHLDKINLKSNQIKSLPLALFQSKLDITVTQNIHEGLNIYDNPIESPPIEIIYQGKKAVLDWFEATKKKLNEIKIILLGDPKAGKTSLLRRLKTGEFDEQEIQTDGINIEQIIFGECESFKYQQSLHKLTAHFWDFGGQEIMNATHQFFLTNRSVYLLVLDARKDTDVAGQVRQWVKRVKATGGNSSIIVIANQSDVNAGFGFSNESDLQTEFPEIKYFIKTSCKTGNGVDEIKKMLEELIPKAELFNTEIDERWIAVKEQLQEETKTNHYLDETRFNQICALNNLKEKSGRLNAIKFLNDLGMVLHFEELNLAQYFVLDPYWITYGVYQIVTSTEAGRLKGIVGMDKLEYIINEEEDKEDIYKPAHFEKIIYDTNQRRFLVDILNQFKLCFYLPGNTGFIIPSLLDTTEPSEVTEKFKKDGASIRFVYKYEYLPSSILPNIMVDMNDLLGAKWRTGCILEGIDSHALISTYQNVLTIIVRGEYKTKREFMAVIRHCVNIINQKLAVKPQMLIPLPGITPVAYAKYEVLLTREAKNKKDYVFDEDEPTERNFEISQLLEGIATPDELMEISQNIKDIQRSVGIIINKIDQHYNYLIQRIDDDQTDDKIIESLKEIKSTQTIEITDEILKQIATAFTLFDNDIDEKLQKIYTDLKETDDIEAKLKLSIPLIKLLGVDLEVGFDLKSWATKMYDKYKLKVFELLM